MRLRKYRGFLALLLVLTLVAAACGGGDDTGDGGGDTGTTAASGGGGGDGGGGDGGSSGETVDIRWFVGLGAGTDAPVIPLQEAIVEQFNSTYGPANGINLILEVSPDPDQSATLMQTQISGGNSPDIAGPVGVKGAAQFFGGWLDLAPYLADYDLTDFDPSLVEFWNQGGVQIGLPFAVFPQILWFNKELFDEAGLAYPPQDWGAPYVDADGNEKPWNLDTLRELAIELTVDSNGLTPNDDGFDPDARVQWGFGNMFNDFRGNASLFGGGSFVAADNETCQFPDNWATAANWYHDAIWDDYFHPDAAFGDSEILGSGNWFNSGNIGMIAIHTWYAGWGTADLTGGDNTDPGDVFDIAAIPAGPDGVITAKLHGDTMGIPKATENPEKAVEVLLWMMSPEIAPQLAAIYGGIPARESAQQPYITDPANDFGFDWNVALGALSYPDIPSHEGWWPAYQESSDAMNEWWTELTNDPGADITAGIDNLCGLLQPIYDRATG
ncbi:MAG: extracellular solute-binding protein [Acidimicrobiia bacterium]|nr:extracellular solute-binding protein [Acidimicrobiia bacterium]